MALGKTITSIYISMISKMKTVVLVPISGLASQWIDEIKKKTSAKTWLIDAEKQPNEWDVAVTFYTVNRINQIPNYICYRIGMLIIDESHMFNNATGIKAVLSFNPRYTVACSGTPTKSTDKMDKVMRSVIGDNITEIVMPVEMDVIKLKTGLYATRQQGHQGVDWTVLKQSLYTNEYRNKMLVDICRQLVEANIKTLVISIEVKHVTLLVDKIKQFYSDVEYICEKKKKYKDSMMTVGIH
jgi:superfamily II DNA or RNA helicase